MTDDTPSENRPYHVSTETAYSGQHDDCIATTAHYHARPYKTGDWSDDTPSEGLRETWIEQNARRYRRNRLHETHICRDCGAEITVPYVIPPDDTSEGLRAAAQEYVRIRDHEDIEGHEAVLEYASQEWRAFDRLRAALSASPQESPGLDINRLAWAFRLHEQENHGEPDPIPVPDTCMHDVKSRYESSAPQK